MLSCLWCRLTILVLSACSIALLPATTHIAAVLLCIGIILIWLIAEAGHAFAKPGSGERAYHEMTDKELGRAHRMWSARASESSSWAALLFAARQVDVIAWEANRRRSELANSSERDARKAGGT
jgi:hypothetical protein